MTYQPSRLIADPYKMGLCEGTQLCQLSQPQTRPWQGQPAGPKGPLVVSTPTTTQRHISPASRFTLLLLSPPSHQLKARLCRSRVLAHPWDRGAQLQKSSCVSPRQQIMQHFLLQKCLEVFYFVNSRSVACMGGMDYTDPFRALNIFK